MRLSLAGLEKGQRIYRHRGPASHYLADAGAFADEIAIRADLRKEGALLMLELSVRVPIHLACDRCGQPFILQHAANDEFYFVFSGSPQSRQDPEMTVIAKGAVELDISQEIRDLVMLSLPLQSLCLPDCRGLCSHCGADLNQESCRCTESPPDPRWEALKKLRSSST